MWVKGVERRMDVWGLIDVAKRVNADSIMSNPAFIPKPPRKSLSEDWLKNLKSLIST